ncbi:hypothetical protein EX30DRAFT_381692 [Ascodesmis nigricans]|uniref:Translation initiation factor 3 N-terminal domain-containing protein n=1 Tax=Ascodesmis nigricans TaxID=341454 RepID=A0A4S2N4K2_9PEZI|nr:hypothetical protein EX30DRAFT_381692 [Ascodesmis nigricans]
MPPRLPLPRLTLHPVRAAPTPLRPLLPLPPIRHNSRERIKPAGPLFDEAIGANTIKYIDESGVFQGLQSLRTLLRRIPRHTHKIQCVGHEAILDNEGNQVDSIPICKLISNEQLVLQHQKAYREKKERQAALKGRSARNQKHIVKTLEFTWAIDPHDLGHRLRKMKGFFEKGNRVEVTIGVKRGMKKMTIEQVRELARIVDEFALRYAKEKQEPEGDVGKKLTLFYESKVDPAKVVEQVKKVEEETEVGKVMEDYEEAAAEYATILRGEVEDEIAPAPALE